MRRTTAVLAMAAALALGPGPAVIARDADSARVAVADPAALRPWDARVARMLREGTLHERQVRADTLIAGREHVRLAQMHRGVPVWGGELVLQREGPRTVSLFGRLYEGIAIETAPALTPDQAVAVAERLSGQDVGPARVPELVVLPLADGGHALAYRLRVAHRRGISLYFIDARSAGLVLELSDLKSQAVVGTGTGVLSDTKKMSTRPLTGGFVTEDQLRPPALLSYDMRGDLGRTFQFLNGQIDLAPADLARDDDNVWTDGAAVDAHTYAGWTYDYYFRRFGRRGLDDDDIRIVSLVHPVRREDFASQPSDIVRFFYVNAFYAGDGVMVYGEGLPVPLQGMSFNFFSGGLDVVAHELTHGVTDYTSRLIYRGESGALNESFSDIMAAGVEFMFQPTGSGPLRADYLVGEDIAMPGGFRSLQTPSLFGDPDHYDVLFRPSGPCGPDNDNCGVHINSGIPNHVFYLAVEGGTNRVSGLAVRGVGAANREQIERAFYRAFTLMLPPSADFSLARATTLQAARDLFGTGSQAERALAEAWTAVGVQ
jgi:bacillolysin